MKRKPGSLDPYAQVGVSSGKEGVHEAVRVLDSCIPEAEGAFCRVIPHFSGDPTKGIVPHADGAGSKANLACLAARNSSMDPADLWRGIAQDSIVMNVDDTACIGSFGPAALVMSIDRNPSVVGDDAISHLIKGTHEFAELITEVGVETIYAAGETADVGDSVRCLVVNHSTTAEILRRRIINISKVIRPGKVIVGFSATGKCNWEEKSNSGIGSNGLTLARHMLLCGAYRSETETFNPATDQESIYCGKYMLDDPLGDSGFTVAEALLSPTRCYAPLLMRIVNMMPAAAEIGFVHCSGGGQTKILNFCSPGIKVVKNNPFSLPPVFEHIHSALKAAGYEDKYMPQTFNCGSRMEAVMDPDCAERVIDIAKMCSIDAQVTGRIEEGDPSERKLLYDCDFGTFEYIK